MRKMFTGCNWGASFLMGALSPSHAPADSLSISHPPLHCSPSYRLTPQPAFPGWSSGLLLDLAILRHLGDKDRRERDFLPVLLTANIIPSNSCFLQTLAYPELGLPDIHK